jgi:hypothetical protein
MSGQSGLPPQENLPGQYETKDFLREATVKGDEQSLFVILILLMAESRDDYVQKDPRRGNLESKEFGPRTRVAVVYLPLQNGRSSCLLSQMAL